SRVPKEKEIIETIDSFIGEIIQVPPMYSAVKVKGKRLYEYARAGIEVERPERQIRIHAIELLTTDELKEGHRFRIKVSCSKGTYIRTLCVDIGHALGYPAHMSYLQRIESDSFQLESTVTLDQVATCVREGKLDSCLYPVDF